MTGQTVAAIEAVEPQSFTFSEKTRTCDVGVRALYEQRFRRQRQYRLPCVEIRRVANIMTIGGDVTIPVTGKMPVQAETFDVTASTKLILSECNTLMV